MFNLIGNKKDSQGISQLHSDPFKHECVEKVVFWIYRDRNSATIELINKHTKAEHKIYANNFPSLVLKVQEFINSLPKES